MCVHLSTGQRQGQRQGLLVLQKNQACHLQPASQGSNRVRTHPSWTPVARPPTLRTHTLHATSRLLYLASANPVLCVKSECDHEPPCHKGSGQCTWDGMGVWSSVLFLGSPRLRPVFMGRDGSTRSEAPASVHGMGWEFSIWVLRGSASVHGMGWEYSIRGSGQCT